MRPQQLTAVLALVVLAGAAAVLAISLGGDGADDPMDGRGASAPHAPSAGGRAAGDNGVPAAWRVGARGRWDVRVESSVDVAAVPAAGGAGAQLVRHTTTGRLHARVLGSGAGATRVAFVLDEPKVTAAGAASAAVERELGQPFICSFDDSGAVLDVAVGGRVSGETAQRLEGLIRTFQLVGPEYAMDADAWEVDELDATGTVRVAYTRVEDGSFAKTKREYVRLTAGADHSARVVRSRGSFTPSVDGVWHERAEVEEIVVVYRGATRLAQVSLRGDLTAVPGGGAGPAALDRVVRSGLDVAERGDAEVEADRVQTRAATPADRRRFADLVATLRAADGRDVAAQRALLGLVREVPELATAIPELVAEGGKANTALLHVLQLADHGPAHEALVAVFDDDEQASDDRLRAIIALGGTTVSDDAIVDRLTAVARDGSTGDPERVERAHTALLASGRLAASLGASAPAVAERLGATLVGELGAAAGDDARAVATLRAIGNTRDERLQSTAAEYARTDSRANVRAAAVLALGDVAGDDAIAMITEVLASDRDPQPRAAAARALVGTTVSPPETYTVVVRRLPEERDVFARRSLVRWLGDRLETFPAGRRALEDLLTTERDTKTRALIAARLATKR